MNCFVVGLSLQVWQLDNPWRVVGGLLLPLLVIGGALLVKEGVRRLKTRITYPRTGYVAYRQGEPRRGRWLVVAAMLALPALLLLAPEEWSQMPLVIGLILAVVLATKGYRVSLGRFYLLAGLAVVVGLGATALTTGDIAGAALVLGGTGTLLLLSGLGAFLAYLRRHPDVAEEAL